jgi:hypothetical protein
LLARPLLTASGIYEKYQFLHLRINLCTPSRTQAVTASEAALTIEEISISCHFEGATHPGHLDTLSHLSFYDSLLVGGARMPGRKMK